jgi:hypothetical protein
MLGFNSFYTIESTLRKIKSIGLKLLTSSHKQLEIGWCERSEADRLENPLVFGQAYLQRTRKPINQLFPWGLLRGRRAAP